jgi:ArsR family transcriptional regulator
MRVDTLVIHFDMCQYVDMSTLTPRDEICCAPLATQVLDPTDAIELASILKALADPVRLQLVSIIAMSEQGESCACDLPALVDRSQPTISHHLSQLVQAGIVEREQRGKWAWFRLRSERLQALCTVLCGPADTSC